MDVFIPYKAVKEYLQTDVAPEEFAKKLSLCGPSIERWTHNEAAEDVIFDVEVTSNRVDMASFIGIAREGSAILDAPFIYKQLSEPILQTDVKELRVRVDIPDLCKRYEAIVIDDVTIGPSPEWMQKRLTACGVNPINVIVDITNYVLLEYGQPIHAFDYNKINGHEIIVRQAHKGEQTRVLSGTDVVLDTNTIVIADPASVIGVAGIMGGKESSITGETKTIVIESANFDAPTVRKSWRKLNLQTDAASLFEKGLHPEGTHPALLRVVQLIQEYAGGKVASTIHDMRKEPYVPRSITVESSLIERVLGVSLEAEVVIRILTKLGFSVKKEKDRYLVTVPYFRDYDVVYDYDIPEEVARIYGYYNIPSELPDGAIPAVKPDPKLGYEDMVKDWLAGAGLTEIYAHSMISEKHLHIAGIPLEHPLSLANPLTQDYVYMREELASTMLDIAVRNETFDPQLKIFELNRVYLPTGTKSLPLEQSNLAVLVNGESREKTFYEAKGIWEYIENKIGMDKQTCRYVMDAHCPIFDPRASARIVYAEKEIGIIGVVSAGSKAIAGSKKENAIIEINFDLLADIIADTIRTYTPVAKYPSVSRDFAFVLESDIPWEEIDDVIRDSVKNLVTQVDLVDVYTGKHIASGKKSITVRVTLQSDDRTLSDEDITRASDAIIAAMKEKFTATIRS